MHNKVSFECTPGFISPTRPHSAALFAPAGITLRERVIHAIAASSSHFPFERKIDSSNVWGGGEGWEKTFVSENRSKISAGKEKKTLWEEIPSGTLITTVAVLNQIKD